MSQTDITARLKELPVVKKVITQYFFSALDQLFMSDGTIPTTAQLKVVCQGWCYKQT